MIVREGGNGGKEDVDGGESFRSASSGFGSLAVVDGDGQNLELNLRVLGLFWRR